MKLISGVATLAVTALLLASTACSGSNNSPPNSAEAQRSTVRSPLISDPPPLDPDVVLPA